jgi:DNA-binding transcriptional ArsR family regulator
MAGSRGADSVDVSDVLEGAKSVLASKGRDIFAKLKDHERKIAHTLHEVGEDSLRSLARRLKKDASTVSVQVKRLTDLGYVEVRDTSGRRAYYRLSRALEEYLNTLQ